MSFLTRWDGHPSGPPTPLSHCWPCASRARVPPVQSGHQSRHYRLGRVACDLHFSPQRERQGFRRLPWMYPLSAFEYHGLSTLRHESEPVKGKRSERMYRTSARFCHRDSVYRRLHIFGVSKKKVRHRESPNSVVIALRTDNRPLACQDGGTPFRQERISSTPGRALKSSSQHCLVMFHIASVNPRRIAFSGFFGRTPSMTARMTLSLPERSWYGARPHKTWLPFQCLQHQIYQREALTS